MADGWSRERTLARLRERAAKREELRAPRIKHEEPALHAAALAHFGTFANAARAAGIAPRPRRKLTRAAIIEDLRELDRRGVRMTASDVVDAGHNDLMSAMHRYFGGFLAARKAAGIPAPPRKEREVRWGRDEVIAAIRRAFRKGEPLSHSRADRDLFRGAINSYKTWRAAVEAAGIAYEKVQLRPSRYSDDELLDVLRAIHRRYPEMTQSELHFFPPHGNILRQRFGNLRAAARRIGIADWPRRGKPVPPSAAETLRGLRARAAAGQSYGPTSLAAEAPQLALGAVHHFGGIAQAVKTAGLAPINAARRAALIAEILEEIRRRDRRGRSLDRSDVLRASPQLVHRCNFYFGSWRRATKLALARRPIRTQDFGGGFARRLRSRPKRPLRRVRIAR